MENITTKQPGRSGFTLIELLVVVAIIGILLGIILRISGMASKKGAEAKVREQVTRIKDALEEYRLIKNAYPPNGLSDLDDIPDVLARLDLSTVSSNEWRDYWNNPIQYTRLGQFEYELYSLGADATNDMDNIR